MKRLGLVFAFTVAIVLLGSGLASAHVTVNPSAVTAGSYPELTFRAPNEQAKANFTKLVVHLPAAHPLGSVSPRSIPGWSITTTTGKLDTPIVTDDGTTTEYLSSITWTATDGGIAPEQYQDFAVSAGEMPESGPLIFTVDQTYSDGTVVHWNEMTKPGAAEPEHPAPVLQINSPGYINVSTLPAKTDTTSRGLSIAALALGVIAVGLTGFGLRRRRAQV